MSIKTLRKRIALVAVSALGAGLMSVVAAPVANASDITYNATSAIPIAGQLNIGVYASTTGAAVLGAAGTLGEPDEMRSLGFVSKSSTTGTAIQDTGVTTAIAFGDDSVGSPAQNDTTGTIVALAGAKLAVAVGGSVTSGHGVSLVVTGGTLSGLLAYTNNGASTATTINGSSTIAWHNSGGTQNTLGAVFNLTAAAGSTATISAYTGANVDGTSSATNGELIASVTITVAAASASGAYSAGDSSIYVQTPMAKGGTASGNSGFDYALRANNGEVHVIYVALKDAYGSALADADIAALTAATTNGATVNIVGGSAGASDSYAATAAFDTEGGLGSDGIGYVVVNQPTANTAGSSVLTLTLDGTVIATKTLNWNGDIASLAIVESSSAKTFLNPTTFSANAGSPAVAVKNIVYVAKDAAGNVLTLGSHPAISDESGSMVGASLSTVDAGTGAITDDSALQTQAIGYGVATMLIPNSTLRGAGEYRIKITNAAGATIKSQAVKTTVTGAVNTFTAAWDKTTYAPGEIATLTITGLDSGGRPVGTGVALGSTALVTTNTDGLASVTSSCDAANIVTATTAYYIDGVKTCKFAVKNTEGAYAYTVVVANASSQAAIAGTINVKATTSAVTNAEVLAAIVKLIASINKQIKALQKSLRR